MATYTKPTDIPRWADTSSNIVEPAEAKKDEGWLFEEIPPSSYENWRTKLNGEWWKWIDERFDDGATADELRSLFPLEIQDADFKLVLNGNPAIAFDAGDNDFMQYVRSTNTYELRIANAIEYEFDAAEADWNSNNLSNVNTLGATTVNATTVNATNIDIDNGVFDGVVVGYAGTPATGQVKVGDDNFRMQWNSSTDVRLYFEGNGFFHYDRDDDFMDLYVGGTQSMRFRKGDMNIGGSLLVGSTTASTPTLDGTIVCDGGLVVGNLTDAPVAGQVFIDGGLRVGSGFTTAPGLGYVVIRNGLVVGYDGAPFVDRVSVGNADTYLSGAGSNTTLNAALAAQINLTIGGFNELRCVTAGVSINNGLYVGDISGTPTDNDIYAVGDIDAGGDGTFGSITMTGFSVDASGNAIANALTVTTSFTAASFNFDATDYMDFSNNTYMRWFVNNVQEMHLHAGQGLSVDKGLSVGYIGAAAAEDGKFYLNGDMDATGYIECSDSYFNNSGIYYFVRETNRTSDPSRLEYTGTQIRTYLGSTMIMQVISAGIEMQNKDISGINALAAWGADEITFKDDIAFDEIDPRITFDTGDYIWYDESENIFGFVQASYTWNRWEARLPNDSNTTYFEASTTVAYADATSTVRQEDLSNQGWYPPDHDTFSGAAWATQVSANYAPSFPVMRLIGAANQSSSGNDVVTLEFWDSPRSASSDQGITGAIWGFGGDFDIGTLGRNGQMSVYGHQGLYLHTGLGGPSGTYGVYFKRDDSTMCQITSSGTSTNVAQTLGSTFTDLVSLNIYGDEGRLRVGWGLGSVTIGGTGTTTDRAYIKMAAGLTTDVLYSTNYPAIYGKDNGSGSKDIWVTDSSNNHTQISPHVDGDRWVFRSKNPTTGRNIEVDMDKLVALVEKLSGETLMKHLSN